MWSCPVISSTPPFVPLDPVVAARYELVQRVALTVPTSQVQFVLVGRRDLQDVVKGYAHAVNSRCSILWNGTRILRFCPRRGSARKPKVWGVVRQSDGKPPHGMGSHSIRGSSRLPNNSPIGTSESTCRVPLRLGAPVDFEKYGGPFGCPSGHVPVRGPANPLRSFVGSRRPASASSTMEPCPSDGPGEALWPPPRPCIL